MRARLNLVAFVCCCSSLGCATKVTSTPEVPPCEEECRDEVAVRALRETMKLAYNLTLQGKRVGAHDESTPCPLGGTARVLGVATSNAEQGATEVTLVYILDRCAYLFKDNDPKQTYSMTLTGTMSQAGIIAVQPTATTAMVMKGDPITFAGTVYDPPVPYEAVCPIELGQNGNILTGKVCGRVTKTDL